MSWFARSEVTVNTVDGGSTVCKNAWTNSQKIIFEPI